MTAALVGCGGSEQQNPDFAAVRGRLEASAETVTVARIEADGRLELVASADVQGRSSYRIEEVEAGPGPYLIEAMSGSEVTGRALIPVALVAGSEHVAVPIDAESTSEADAYLELSGSAEIDPITLMAVIDAELALESRANVVAAAKAAHDAWLDAAARLRGSAVSAGELARARARAFADLAADLDAAATAEAKQAAWLEFFADAALYVETELGLDASEQATAWAALSFTLSAKARTEAHAAFLIAASSRVAHQAAVRGRAEALASIDAAYDAFLAELRSDGALVAEARAELESQLLAVVSGLEADASALIAAELALAPLVAAAKVELEAAMTGNVSAGSAEAYAELHARARAVAGTSSSLSMLADLRTQIDAGISAIVEIAASR